MSLPLEWDTSLGKTKKQPALVVDPVHGVLPYDGFRNPLTRSNTAHRISMAIARPATKGQRKIYHFDGAREMAVALEALLSPELYGLEVQLPPVSYRGVNGKSRSHSFDLRITFRDGFRRAVYVRHGQSLARPETQDEIRAIFAATPKSFADDKFVVNGDQYTKRYRDNLLRIWNSLNTPDPDIDAQVLECARNTNFWLMSDLIAKCHLSSAQTFQAIFRLIGQGYLKANWNGVICRHSRIWIG
ncbi:hypothetical protein [Halocynthiibacter styelae]|uniref:TnsA endonuclease N-terminal domain-containing protein n=1 Tax=Halocynthiibacter styelae TaxID=2761955 RepID=A0A8J7IF40_9RHOB|nr:hypothetical protein [Paenihalocynthiibacter styelae]MBI1494502.1 hypothetical protein [Paenihalocynthiibacter styelae]